MSSCLPSVPHELAIGGRGFGHVVGGDCTVRPPQQHIGRDLAAHDRDLRRQVHPDHAQHPPSLPCSLLPSPSPAAAAASTCLPLQTQALDPPPPGGSAITCPRRAPPALPPPIQTPALGACPCSKPHQTAPASGSRRTGRGGGNGEIRAGERGLACGRSLEGSGTFWRRGGGGLEMIVRVWVLLPVSPSVSLLA